MKHPLIWQWDDVKGWMRHTKRKERKKERERNRERDTTTHRERTGKKNVSFFPLSRQHTPWHGDKSCSTQQHCSGSLIVGAGWWVGGLCGRLETMSLAILINLSASRREELGIRALVTALPRHSLSRCHRHIQMYLLSANRPQISIGKSGEYYIYIYIFGELRQWRNPWHVFVKMCFRSPLIPFSKPQHCCIVWGFPASNPGSLALVGVCGCMDLLNLSACALLKNPMAPPPGVNTASKQGKSDSKHEAREESIQNQDQDSAKPDNLSYSKIKKTTFKNCISSAKLYCNLLFHFPHAHSSPWA